LWFALLLDLVAVLDPGPLQAGIDPSPPSRSSYVSPWRPSITTHEQFPQHTSSNETPFKKLSFIFNLTFASRKNIHQTFLGKDKPRDDEEANFLCIE
jgi:hypothetical protein